MNHGDIKVTMVTSTLDPLVVHNMVLALLLATLLDVESTLPMVQHFIQRMVPFLVLLSIILTQVPNITHALDYVHQARTSLSTLVMSPFYLTLISISK